MPLPKFFQSTSTWTVPGPSIRLPDPWGNPLIHLLAPASILFRAGVAGRRKLYDLGWKSRTRLRAPTISVGNLTVGGTGKTPLVEWIARWLVQRGHQPAILSRGYGRVEGKGVADDEAFVVRPEMRMKGATRRIDRNRVRAGQSVLEDRNKDCILLDDGFQHFDLKRDLDLVCVDATVPPAQRYRLLPWGPFREPVSALERATFVVLTRVDQVACPQVDEWRRIVMGAAGVPVLETTHEPVCWMPWPEEGRESTARWQGKKAYALCGIGNPASFLRTVEQLDVRILGASLWPDHATFSAGAIEKIRIEAMSLGCDVIVTTEKDAARLDRQARWPLPVAVLRVGLAFRKGQDLLEQRLEGLFARAAGGEK